MVGVFECVGDGEVFIERVIKKCEFFDFVGFVLFFESINEEIFGFNDFVFFFFCV